MAQEQQSGSLGAAKAQVAASYASSAAAYSAWVLERPLNRSLFGAFAALLQAELAGQEGAQILDLASASGEPAATIARALPSAAVLATDLSPEFVALGRARAAALGLPNLQCRQADAESLAGLDDGAFDAATCCMGLMFMDLERALPQACRVLRPGGLLAAAVWQSAGANPFWCSFIPALSAEIDAGGPASDPADAGPYSATRFGDPSELLAALAAAGLQQAECRALPVTYCMSAAEWWPTLLNLPDTPFKAAVERAEAKAGSPAEAAAVAEAAWQTSERRLRERGWMQADGSVLVPDQMAWLVTARKPL